mmetsp:Transcript_27437/g.50565  ORF Transcript_27437/g.50565 Transcript_27437/m.50565 type:complete len:242 (+) Transcript_27437:4637-5362(+)
MQPDFRGARQHKDHHIGEVFGLGKDVVWHVLVGLGEHVGVGPALVKARDADAGFGLVGFEHVGKATHAVFRRGIDRLPGLRDDPGFGGDVEDDCLVPIAQMRDQMLGQLHERGEVGVDRGHQHVGVDAVQRAGLVPDACVVDQDVNAVEIAEDRLRRVVQRACIAHVAGIGVHLGRAQCGAGFGHFGEPCGVAPEDGEPAVFLGQFQADMFADAVAAAGDDHGFAAELHDVRLLPGVFAPA